MKRVLLIIAVICLSVSSKTLFGISYTVMFNPVTSTVEVSDVEYYIDRISDVVIDGDRISFVLKSGTSEIATSAFYDVNETNMSVPFVFSVIFLDWPMNLNSPLPLTIGASAFLSSGLWTITFPSWVPNSTLIIEGEAFAYSQITELRIRPWVSNNKVEIGNYAFGSCPYLAEVFIPAWSASTQSTVTIAGMAFSETSIGRFELSTAITEIGDNAFMNTELKEVVVPQWESNRSCTLGDAVFDLPSVQKVIFKGNVIPTWAFANDSWPMTDEAGRSNFKTRYYVDNEAMKQSLISYSFDRLGETFFIPEENIILPKNFAETGKVELLTPNLSYGSINFQPEIGYKFDLTDAQYGVYYVTFCIRDARSNVLFTEVHPYAYMENSNPIISWILQDKKLAGTGTVYVEVVVQTPNSQFLRTTGSFSITSDDMSSIPDKPTGISSTQK